jgi:hypothetical protein
MNERIVGAARGWTIGASIAIALLTASAAAAEPIQIISGSTSLYWDGDLTSFQLNAANSQFISEFHGTPAVFGFRGGELVNLSGAAAASNQAFHGLAQTVEGTHYADVWLSGGLSLMVAPFVAPHTSEDGALVNFTLPFTMTGQINGFANRDLTGPLFSVAVAGGGTTSVTYRTFPDDSYSLPHVGGQGFTFTAQPAATPEPASLFLMATGVAGVIVRHVRRRKEI